MSPSQIRIKHGTVREMIGGGWMHLRPGETSDDTALALALAESLISCATYDREDAAKRYLDWLKTGPKDVGNTTRASLVRISEGAEIADAAKGTHSEVEGKTAGNGALMRTAPLALAFPGDVAGLVKNSRADASLTHFDPVAGFACAALNLLISTALGPGKEKAGVMEAAREKLLQAGESGVLPDPLKKRSYDMHPTGYALNTLECAMWAFLKGGSFEECIVLAVNLGGEAGTVGSVCGALAGAWYGAPKIPERWLAVLDRKAELEAAARKFFERSAGSVRGGKW
jgi:ADP-ribosyl-[dinitrogen reductase] hydrolase